MSPESSASRRFWRFSLRQLLALCVLLGVLLAILAPRFQSSLQLRKEQQAQYDIIRRQGALKRAIMEGQGAERVRQALEAGALLSVPMDDYSLPFHCAITLGQCDTVQVLLDHGADVEQVDFYNPHPQKYPRGSALGMASGRGPPLFAAVDCDQPTDIKIQMIRILLAQGADVRCEVDNVNLMDLAARHGDGAIGDLLRGHGLPYGPREMAAFHRTKELERAVQESPDLLQERFKPFEIGHKFPVSTLLGIALRKDYRDMARMLIEAGAPLDVREHDGQSPLHIAATFSGDPQLIRLLIAHGAGVNAMDDQQLTPLAATRHWKGREAAQAALIEAGAK